MVFMVNGKAWCSREGYAGGHAMEIPDAACPRGSQGRADGALAVPPAMDAFGIHPGFAARFRSSAGWLSVILVIGVVLMLCGLYTTVMPDQSLHAYQHENGAVPLLAGLLFTGASLYACFSNYRWLRRASAVLNTVTPLPALLTTRPVAGKYFRMMTARRPRIRMMAAIRPREHATTPFAPIDNIPLFIGMATSLPSGNLTYYRDAPAMVYFPPWPDYPMVLVVDGEYLCTRRKPARYTAE